MRSILLIAFGAGLCLLSTGCIVVDGGHHGHRHYRHCAADGVANPAKETVAQTAQPSGTAQPDASIVRYVNSPA